MKKIVALMLILIIGVIVVGCSGANESENPSTESAYDLVESRMSYREIMQLVNAAIGDEYGIWNFVVYESGAALMLNRLGMSIRPMVSLFVAGYEFNHCFSSPLAFYCFESDEIIELPEAYERGSISIEEISNFSDVVDEIFPRQTGRRRITDHLLRTIIDAFVESDLNTSRGEFDDFSISCFMAADNGVVVIVNRDVEATIAPVNEFYIEGYRFSELFSQTIGFWRYDDGFFMHLTTAHENGLITNDEIAEFYRVLIEW